ncbi:uncharacterized protein LOC118487449 [Helianthus annuus]|uniref:uncharacterized protein LOC118487449 n=1 Tax=Helianthus annuus TaxID=4232 RepID=UPI001652E892|nr:uncharacterized protein LOC118487449 [Helianthus annuus]
MDSEIYNAFATPITMAQNVNLENEMGTMQKPPKLMNIKEYSGWEECFENWVQANHLEAWECVKERYVRPIDEYGEIVAIKELDEKEKKKYKSEKMMISILQQAIKEDILILLQHNENNGEFENLSLSKFIEKLEVQEMEQRKMAKMKNSNGEQDIGLYYKGNSTAEDEIVYAYYESQQFSPKKKEEESVSTKEASEKVKWKRSKKDMLRKKKNHKAATVEEKIKPEENVRVVKKEVNEIPAIKVEKEADTEKIPQNKSSNEEEIAMNTLNGAFMTKQKIINQYIEKCAELEQKLETHRIETKRVNRIYPIVEGMEAFEEKKYEVKNTGDLGILTRRVVTSDDEEVPVVRRQKVKEVPKFKVEEEVDAKKIPVKHIN